MFMGFIPSVHAVEDEDLPELPSMEVTSNWNTYNLSKPVLVKTVAPRLDYKLAGTEVLMTFKLGKHGKPYSIRYEASLNEWRKRQLGEAMKLSLKDCKFTPALDEEGEAVAIKLALPVRAVGHRKVDTGNYASVNMTNPLLLAVLDR